MQLKSAGARGKQEPAACSRWTDSSASDDQVISGAHPSHCFDNLALVILYDLDSLEVDTELEAELGKVR